MIALPTSPASQEQFADEIRRIYAEAEAIMLQRVAKRLARGIEEEGWAEKKLLEIQTLRREVERELVVLRKANREAAQEVEKAYVAGSHEAEKELSELLQRPVAQIAPATHRMAVEGLVQSMTRLLEQSHFPILREVEDIYRRVIFEATSQVLTGTLTRREAAQVALNRFALRGIAGFVDKSGRNWDMASYAEMAVRSSAGQAAVQGHVDRLTENGYDLVIVSDSPEECPLCRPWEGKVLSLTGATRGYSTLSDARRAGLFHPNCTHSVGAYIPGLTRPMKRTAAPQAYEDRQKQRYIERQIRHWKRREAVAITEQSERQARAKVREWQARMREHLRATDREFKRNYARESITRAR